MFNVPTNVILGVTGFFTATVGGLLVLLLKATAGFGGIWLAAGTGGVVVAALLTVLFTAVDVEFTTTGSVEGIGLPNLVCNLTTCSRGAQNSENTFNLCTRTKGAICSEETYSHNAFQFSKASALLRT